MNLLIEFIPIVAFFAIFKLYDIYAATTTAIIISSAQIIILLALKKKVTAAQYIGLILILVFGGLTIYLRDEIFIKLKPSILYLLFAVILFSSNAFYKINLIEKAMSKEITLKEHLARKVWGQANLSWIIFFILMSLTNLVIALNFSKDIWADFKLASIGILLVFVISQGVWLSRHSQEQ